MPKIFFIIATWNSEKFLSDLFWSLKNMDYPKEDWNLVVVDNGSKDKTLEILNDWQKKMFNFPTIIRNEKNLGFASGYNQGITYALKHNPDYIILLNDDTIVEPDWLNIIIQKMDNQPAVGLSQPLLTRYPQKNLVNSFGNSFHFLGFGYSLGDNCPVEQVFDKYGQADYEPAYLSFSAVVIRRAVFETIGLLDEKYFAYHEDSDFCFRARLADWQLLAVSNAVVHHNYHFPSTKNKQRYFWLEKNRLYLTLKFYKLRTLILALPAFLIMELGLIVFSIARGFFWQRLKAYGWLIINLPSIIKSRRDLQQARKFGDYRLFDFMTGRIDFQEIQNPLLKYIGNPILGLYFKIIKKFV